MENITLPNSIDELKTKEDIKKYNELLRELDQKTMLIGLELLITKIIKLFNLPEFKNVEKIKLDSDAYYDDQGVDVIYFWVNMKEKGKSWNENAEYQGVYQSDGLAYQVQSFFNEEDLAYNTRDIVKYSWKLHEAIDKKNYKKILTEALSYRLEKPETAKELIESIEREVVSQIQKKDLSEVITKPTHQKKLKV